MMSNEKISHFIPKDFNSPSICGMPKEQWIYGTSNWEWVNCPVCRNAPTCDINSDHGPMQAEPIHHLDGSIANEYGMFWFCQVPGCDGYGGPVKMKADLRRMNDEVKGDQLSLFE